MTDLLRYGEIEDVDLFCKKKQVTLLYTEYIK